MDTESKTPLPKVDKTLSAVQPNTVELNSVQPSDEQLDDTRAENAALFKILRLKLSGAPVRRHNTHFLAWPREIRDMIYNYTLTKPTTRWDTRHRYFCKYRSQNGESEIPAFLTKTTTKSCLCDSCSHRDYREEKRRFPNFCVICGPRRVTSMEALPNVLFCDCTCARDYKRGGELNLRLVNRQMYNEAAALFYERNVLCFDDGYQLVEFFHSLRPAMKNAIRHISLVGGSSRDLSSTDRNVHRGMTWGERVWYELSSLPTLRTLEIRPEHIKNGARWMLESFDYNTISISMASFKHITHVVQDDPRLNKVWIRVTQPLSKTDDMDVIHQEVWNFTSHIVGVTVEKAKDNLSFHRDRSDLTDNRNPVEVEIRTPVLQRRKVVAWGLSSTIAMRVELAREQRKEDEQRIANGQLTRREEAMMEKRKKLLQAKELLLAMKEKENLEREVREANERKLENEREQELQEEKAHRKQKSKQKASIRKAQETKLHERKRVPDT